MFRLSIYVLLSFLVHRTPASIRYFWQITDPHIDPYYWSNNEINSCNEVIQNRGIYGDYECDSPYKLLQSAVKAMVNNGREPEFIVYSGDTPGHLKQYTDFDQSTIVSFLQNVTELFNHSFPGVTFVIALGNHDYYPDSQLPGNKNAIYEAVAEMWKPWFGNNQEIVDSFKKGAYYTQLVNPSKKLRVVVINTNLYSTNNLATEGENDPADQYTWLEQVLSTAESNSEKVHLIMHIPLGVMPSSSTPRWLRDADNSKLIDMITRFSDVIIGTYAGHEHLDTFRIMYKNGKPVSTMFLAPSVTPWRARLSDGSRSMAHNPGIRKVFFDDDKAYLDNIEQFYLDLPKANQDREAQWLRLYTFKGLYVGIDNLTSPVLHQLAESFQEYGNNNFHVYYDWFSVGARHISNEPCSCLCKFSHICSIQSVNYTHFDMCHRNIACDGNHVAASVAFIFLSFICHKLVL